MEIHTLYIAYTGLLDFQLCDMFANGMHADMNIQSNPIYLWHWKQQITMTECEIKNNLSTGHKGT